MADLKERFRALDAIAFPHEAGPPVARGFHTVREGSFARRGATVALAASVAAAALVFAVGSLGALGDRDRRGILASGGSETPSQSPSASAAGTTVEVPDLIGSQEQDAMSRLYELGLTWLPAYRALDGVAHGKVARQVPPPGAVVEPGATVQLVISTEFTPLPVGAAEALDCSPEQRVTFGGPDARLLPGGATYIADNLPGVADDEVLQVTFEDEEWHGIWHVVREGAVVAVVDWATLDGVACIDSGVAGA
jgi:hypothetical protein